MKSILSGTALLILLMCIYAYMYGMATGCFGAEANAKAFYLLGMGFYSLYVLFIFTRDRTAYYEKNFIEVGLAAMSIFFIVGVLNNFGYLSKEPYTIMKWFTGLLIAVTIMVLTSGVRHDLFKN